jgi:voltage-gated potassium channel Kch
MHMADSQIEYAKKELDNARKQLVAIGVAAVALLSVGAIFFHITEKLSWVDAFYFCTVSLGTVGYGDIVPETDAEKIFIIFYMFIGIGIIATFANLIFKSASLRRDYRHAKRRTQKMNKE